MYYIYIYTYYALTAKDPKQRGMKGILSLGPYSLGPYSWDPTVWDPTVLARPISDLDMLSPALKKEYIGPFNASVVQGIAIL